VLSLVLPWGIGDGVLTWQGGALLLLLGLCAGVGHWAMIGAFMLAPASLLTPFTYLQMVWAIGYGYLIFGQLPDRWSAVGMTVIVASGLLLALQERQRARWPRTDRQ
jgi:drug/metabolite transporter (DMT)-like permease